MGRVLPFDILSDDCPLLGGSGPRRIGVALKVCSSPMSASAYKRPFAEPKGCISERQQPANSGHSEKGSQSGPWYAIGVH